MKNTSDKIRSILGLYFNLKKSEPSLIVFFWIQNLKSKLKESQYWKFLTSNDTMTVELKFHI